MNRLICATWSVLVLIAFVKACQPAPISPTTRETIANLAEAVICMPTAANGNTEPSDCIPPSPLQSLSRSHWGPPTSSCTYRRDEHADVVTCTYPDQPSESELGR